MSFMQKTLATILLMSAPAVFGAAKLQSVFLNNSCCAGTMYFGSVNLTEPAGHGGAVVAVSSADTAALTCPASVTVLEGSTYADLYCDSHPVTQQIYFLISGTYKNTTVTQQVAVTPAFMSSFTVNASSIQGGSDVYFAAVMNGLVANDTVITLSGDNPSITLPASLTVPANSGSGTLLWTTPVVTTQQTVTITATQTLLQGGTATYTATLTITP